MDIAALFAALALCALIQGAMLLLRWQKINQAPELGLAALANVAIGIGAALFGSRYYGGPYITSIGLANALLLSGLALHLQSIRRGDGLKPLYWQVFFAGGIWIAAAATPIFAASPVLRVGLYSLVSTSIAAAAALHLGRNGLRLRSRQLWFVFWTISAICMASRLLDIHAVIQGVSSGLFASTSYAIHLILACAATMGLGYIHLALSDGLPRIDRFMQALERRLMSDYPHTLDQHAPARSARLWTLRIDRLSAGRHMHGDVATDDIDRIAAAITSVTPNCRRVWRAGVDRLVWVGSGAGDPGGDAAAINQLATRLGAVAATSPTFPKIAMSCGACTGLMGDVTAAIAAAERNAVLIAQSQTPFKVSLTHSSLTHSPNPRTLREIPPSRYFGVDEQRNGKLRAFTKRQPFDRRADR